MHVYCGCCFNFEIFIGLFSKHTLQIVPPFFFNEVTEVKDDFANWNIVIIFKDCGHSYLFERFHFLKALIHGSESVYR